MVTSLHGLQASVQLFNMLRENMYYPAVMTKISLNNELCSDHQR